MPVAHSSASESHTGTTASVNEASFSWTHTQTGTPQGVVVFVHEMSIGTAGVTGATYGGKRLYKLGAAFDNLGEPGRTTAYFRCNDLPSGNQSIVVTRSAASAEEVYASAITVTASRIVGITAYAEAQADQALTEKSLDDGYSGSLGTNSMRYAAVFSGLNAPPAAGANSTLLTSFDTGNQTAAMVRETTAGKGARLVGFSGASDDVALISLCLREELLIAGARATSLIPNVSDSEDIGDPANVITGLTLTKDTGIAGPFNYGQAALLTETATTGEHTVFFGGASTGVGGDLVYSVYVKASGVTSVKIQLTSTSDVYTFNLSTGTVSTTTADVANADIVDVGGGWYRLSAVGSSTGSGRQFILGSANTVGDGVSGFYVWGPSVTAGTFPVDYVRDTSTFLLKTGQATLSKGSTLRRRNVLIF